MAMKENIPTLDVISGLASRNIEDSVAELRSRDRLTIALRTALKQGADINVLSEASGLTPREIWRRCAADLHVLNDLDVLAGVA
jgi:hypothetical protein